MRKWAGREGGIDIAHDKGVGMKGRVRGWVGGRQGDGRGV